MKTVIFGAHGMLGADLARAFGDWKPTLLDQAELDITSRDAVFAWFRGNAPELAINAAAYTDVDGCEKNRELAMKVNGEAPGYLAEAALAAGAVFVHYSTDYVFSGEESGGYREDDEPGDSINFYGETKLAGERAVQKARGRHYLIRASWLFGNAMGYERGEPKNFVETMLRRAQTGSQLRVVNDQHGKPTSAFDLAHRTRELIEGGKAFGVYHITNEPATTWYDFAQEIIQQSFAQESNNTRDTTSSIPSIISCSSEEFPRPARRPAYSILNNTKLPPSRPWQQALQEYLLARNYRVRT